MSNQREREKRREERLQAESKDAATDRRERMLKLAAGAFFLAIVAVVVVIVVASSSGGGGDTELEGVSEVNQELSGIPQNDLVIGDPKAPVELVEFGDLQCPVCKAFAEDVLPPVIENQVAKGEAKIVFRNFTIIGPDSTPAGTAAVAAGAQGRGWNFIDLFYRNQGAENGGYVDDEFLTAVAKAAGVKDIATWNQERNSPKATEEVENTSAEAQRLGFQGTPSFAIKGPSTTGLEPLGTLGNSGEFEAAIEDAS
ncbi:MAG TPA: thioredoxin domain-containing protein [Solirubrobacterales bacterium]|nr:thioredoxin domain-containing protein [Solirubrobacterales bacterium]